MDPFALAAELVAVPSPTFEEGPYLELLAQKLTGMGLALERQPVTPGRDNLLATVGEPRVLLSTHVDTVPPHFGPRVEGDRLYGRGACDTKGLLASMLVAAERLLADGVRDFGLLLVVGEEQGHDGALAAAELPLRVDRIVLGEPTENRVARAQKGIWRADLEASGTAAHSGYPERGASAIHALLETLAAVRAYAWPEDAELGPTHVNVGLIAGGAAPNVLAPRASASLLFRAVGPLEALEEGLASCLTEGVRVAHAAGNPPFRFDVPPGAEDPVVVAFNTDGPYLAPLGPVTLLGPGSIEVAHSDHEHVDRADLIEGAARYEALVRQTLESPPRGT